MFCKNKVNKETDALDHRTWCLWNIKEDIFQGSTPPEGVIYVHGMVDCYHVKGG